MRTISKLFLTFVIVALVATSGIKASRSADAVTIHVITQTQAAMSNDEMDAVAKEYMAANPNVKVEMEYVSYDALHDKIVTAMASTPPAYDVIMTDVIWYSEFVKAGYLSDVTSRITADMRKNTFASDWNVTTVDGKVYGMPWLLDTKYLYYNDTLLKQAGITTPPTTWEDVVADSKIIKQKGVVEYPMVWSWGQIEASICDYTALVAGNGGVTVDSSGKPAFNSKAGVDTLSWMVQTLTDGLSNPSSITNDEEAVRNVFSSGKAVFATNWLYMENMANFNKKESQVTGQVKMSLMPVFASQAKAGLKSASVDGSSGFSVISTSPNQDAAWGFVQYLTSEPTQIKYSDNQLPIWATSYQGDTLKKLEAISPVNVITVPMFSQQFPFATVRPRVPYYIQGSKALQVALQEAFTKKKTPQQALDDAAAVWNKLAAGNAPAATMAATTAN